MRVHTNGGYGSVLGNVGSLTCLSHLSLSRTSLASALIIAIRPGADACLAFSRGDRPCVPGKASIFFLTPRLDTIQLVGEVVEGVGGVGEVGRKEVEVTIHGKRFAISKKGIEESLKGVSPQRISKYSVLINGNPFPIKQVIAVALGISPLAFGSSTAYQILQGLGFEISE